MELSTKAQALLKRIAQTEEFSLKLTKPIAKPAGELITAGLAMIIPYAQGGGEIALTQAGIYQIGKKHSTRKSGSPGDSHEVGGII